MSEQTLRMYKRIDRRGRRRKILFLLSVLLLLLFLPLLLRFPFALQTSAQGWAIGVVVEVPQARQPGRGQASIVKLGGQDREGFPNRLILQIESCSKYGGVSHGPLSVSFVTHPWCGPRSLQFVVAVAVADDGRTPTQSWIEAAVEVACNHLSHFKSLPCWPSCKKA